MHEYRKKLGIPENHKFIRTETSSRKTKGKDTDIYEYEQLDEEGNLIACYVIEDSTSMYPPFKRSIEYKKL